jgi:dipeptidyl aminopeptidase/acylaminoacyl peptidase
MTAPTSLAPYGHRPPRRLPRACPTAATLAASLLLAALPATAQTTPPPHAEGEPAPQHAPSPPQQALAVDGFDLRQAMADPDWMGAFPENPAWSDDGNAVYFERKRTGESFRDLHRLDLATGREHLVADGERRESPGEAGTLDRAGRRRVYLRDGDVWLGDRRSGTVLQLTRTPEIEAAPRFLADDARVAWRQGDTWVVRELATGVQEHPADLRLAADPDAPPAPDEGYVGAQEERLFITLAERLRRERAAREREAELRRSDPTRAPATFWLGKDLELVASELSPSGRHLAVALGPSQPKAGRRDAMPVWINREGYVRPDEVRPKVGTGQSESPRLALLDLEAGRRVDLDLAGLPGIADDPLADLRAAARARREAGGDHDPAPTPEPSAAAADAAGAQPSPKRPVTLQRFVWSPDGRWLLVALRAVDNKDRWLALVDTTAPAPQLSPLQRLTDSAWINWDFQELGWLPDASAVWYLSEETGWGHLYLHTVTGTRRQLTAGRFEVREPQLTHDGRHAYVRANREHPGQWEIYRVELASGRLERVTRLGGTNSALLSPDETRLLVTHSTALRPPELVVQDIAAGLAASRRDVAAATPPLALPPGSPGVGADGAGARVLTDSRSPAFRAIRLTPPRVVGVPSTVEPVRGTPIWSRVYTPEDAAAAGAPLAARQTDLRPAVVFVHGAGYLQNAHLGWSSYFRELFFHSLLTREGYVVLDMDFRASEGYGRDWRTAIYRWMGKPEVEDLADGVAWLAAHAEVDPSRVGVYGGSYGGFLTFMAMFTRPELFAAGAALRPVTDWAHYSHPYTSNILNTPELDPEAYRRSSPIEHAAGLERPLLICHGMVDDNVLFLDSVRLVQRLIELEKTAWFETAIYPVEPHAFREASSWLDEYRRIHRLFREHLW